MREGDKRGGTHTTDRLKLQRRCCFQEKPAVYCPLFVFAPSHWENSFSYPREISIDVAGAGELVRAAARRARGTIFDFAKIKLTFKEAISPNKIPVTAAPDADFRRRIAMAAPFTCEHFHKNLWGAYLPCFRI